MVKPKVYCGINLVGKPRLSCINFLNLVQYRGITIGFLWRERVKSIVKHGCSFVGVMRNCGCSIC